MLARQIRMIWGKSLLAQKQFPLSALLFPIVVVRDAERGFFFLNVIVALKVPTSASYLDSCPRHRHVL